MAYRSFGAWLLAGGLAASLPACATIGEDVSQTARIVEVEAGVEAVPEPRLEHAHNAGAATRAGVEVIPLQQAMPKPEAVAVASLRVAAAPADPAPAPRQQLAQAATSPFEFSIAEAEKDRTHPYFGVGHGRGFVVNGEQGLELVVVRGKTYTFNVDTGIQHDFYLSTSDTGWGAAAWTQGVSGQFIYQGRVTFSPTADTPDLLYYQCRNHRNMGAAIHVVDAADEERVRAEIAARRSGAAPAAVEPAEPAAPKFTVSEAEVLQKIEFASTFINESAAAERIRESGVQAALDLQRAARQNYIDARDAVSRGDLDIALLLVDESMRIMSEASLHVPRDIEGEAQRAQFEMFYEGARTFRDSYVRNVELMRERDRSKIRQVDLRRIDQAMERARGLADGGQYADAIALLTDAQSTLTRALTEMLADESISYELEFKTPREEYEYERSRYESYERLIPIAIEQRQPTEEAHALMMRSVDRAKEIRGLVDSEVARGNYPEAILMLQGATSHIQRALQVVGVR
jgi:hypothetical protein